jgi:membrane associated rhomboid family serine protease
MGIYDRDYYQEEERGSHFGGVGGRSMVVNLILLNAAIYVADLIFEQRISNALSLRPDLFERPWLAWQLVTYGFVHAPDDITHILFNMFFLWFFGSEVEVVYGKAEFLRIYLSAIVIAGLAWSLFVLTPMGAAEGGGPLLGASGGIMALMILFVLHFPRRLIHIWGILPVPAWAIGTLYVVGDVFGVGSDDLVAHTAHLGGVVYGFVYYRTGLNLGRLVPRRLSLSSLRWRPKLRIHDPDAASSDLEQQVDRILKKISEQGETSLTKRERRTLEEASRRYQRRRQ